MARYLGSFFCDYCSHGGREAVWLLDTGERLCAGHYRQVTGAEPPSVLNVEDLAPPPPAEPPWFRVVNGLRARPTQVAPHGLELQGVRNIRMETGTETVSSSPAWVVPDSALVELVLLASPYRDADEPTKLMVRNALIRVLHGKGHP